MSYINDPDGSGVKIMEFKVTGTIEAKSAKEALRQVPVGFVVTEARAGIEVKSDVEFTDHFVKIADKTYEFKPSKGVNIEGLARQRDLNKLTKQLADQMEALENCKIGNLSTTLNPNINIESITGLTKRVEEIEARLDNHDNKLKMLRSGLMGR